MGSLLKDLGIEPGALLVNIVSFGILLWLMKRFLFGPVGSFLEQRKQRIADEIAAAEADRAKAAAERAEIESRRAEIMRAVHEAGEAAKEAAAREADTIKKSARGAAREIERSAHAATARDEQEAAGRLSDELTAAATSMCRRLLRDALDEERHRALLDQFIADIEKMAAEQQGSQ